VVVTAVVVVMVNVHPILILPREQAIACAYVALFPHFKVPLNAALAHMGKVLSTMEVVSASLCKA
jgi:hypothetical protein